MDTTLCQYFPQLILTTYEIKKKKKKVECVKDISLQEILRCTSKAQIRNSGRYLDKDKYKWYQNIKYLWVYYASIGERLPPWQPGFHL